MRVGIISDLHMDTKGKGYEKLEEAVEDIESVGTDVNFVLGDFLGNATAGEDEVIDKAERRDLHRFLTEKLSSEVIFVNGNHEQVEREQLENLYDNDFYGHVEVDGENFVWLDSSAPELSGSRGQISEDQLEFLKEMNEKLEEYILIVHHPIHYRDLEDAYWWDTYPERAFCGNKKELNRLIDSEKVKAVFNGHIHDYDHTNYESIDHITVPPFVEEKRDYFEGDYVIAEFENGIEIDLMRQGENYQSFNI